MGGCRCCFRNCKVSTSRNPGMHFFRFPKRGTYLKDWIRFSGLTEFFNIPESQQRNKVICARHFKATMFMNYKQDRLVPTAVPTITRLSPEYAFDYEQDLINPKVVKIDVTKAPHLIAPADIDFKDPQYFTSEDLKFCADVLERCTRDDGNDNTHEPSKRIKLMEAVQTNDVSEPEDRLTEEFFESLMGNDIDWALEDTEDNTSPKQTKEIQPSPKEDLNCLKELYVKELKAQLAAKDEELIELKAKLDSQNTELCFARHQMKMLTKRNDEMKVQLASETKKQQITQTETSDAESKHNKLLKVHNQLKAQQHINLLGTATLTKTEMPESQRAAMQCQQLSKQQLFNGIRRYLSPTMVALLRMQLASCNAERDWKPDELRVAADLLGLGHEVYKYFTDEWLIRLPSISSVLNWQNQFATPDDEEDDL